MAKTVRPPLRMRAGGTASIAVENDQRDCPELLTCFENQTGRDINITVRLDTYPVLFILTEAEERPP